MEGREGTLYFQIIHGRVARQINTGYRLFPSEWDEHASEIILSYPMMPEEAFCLR